MEIRDKKGSKNVVADHLSRLEGDEDPSKQPLIYDNFPDEFILALKEIFTPWYADFANYLAGGVLPEDLSYQEKKRFLFKVRQFLWEEPFIYKICEMGLLEDAFLNQKCLMSSHNVMIWFIEVIMVQPKQPQRC